MPRLHAPAVSAFIPAGLGISIARALASRMVHAAARATVQIRPRTQLRPVPITLAGLHARAAISLATINASPRRLAADWTIEIHAPHRIECQNLVVRRHLPGGVCYESARR